MRILMCDPEHFGIYYKINPWMNPENQADSNLATKQWTNLVEAIKSSGAEVTYIQPHKDYPDMVFTANAGAVKNKVFVPSNFRYKERQGESCLFEQWFASNGFEIRRLPAELYFEGAGDMLLLDEIYFGASGFRSNVECYSVLSDLLDIDIVRLELKNDYFYHLDTCFTPLGDSVCMYYPDAFTDKSINKIESHSNAYKVCKEDAMKFACNAIVIGKHIVMPSGCLKTKEWLQDAGFTVHEVDLDQYLKSGGSAKCLSLDITAL